MWHVRPQCDGCGFNRKYSHLLPNNFIDLYADTKSKPTAGMRRYMMSVDVGDEQKDEDENVLELNRRVAELLGMEAAVFLPSGTMCNEIALLVHCRPGDEIILDRSSHIVNSEAGGPSALCGATIYPIDGERGVFTADQLRAVIRPESRYMPVSRVVSVEQTANFGGGKIWPLQAIREVLAVAQEKRLIAHLDGARLMNAVIASGVSAAEYASGFDSAWIDLSKGLGCPVGGVLAGSRDFIKAAWRWKQRIGGAMRQAGFLAAAGNYALDNHVERLAVDHANAKRLAQGVSSLPGVDCDVDEIDTNIVFFDIGGSGMSGPDFVAALKAKGVGMGAFGGMFTFSPTTIRAVTHVDISADQIDVAVGCVDEVVRAA